MFASGHVPGNIPVHIAVLSPESCSAFLTSDGLRTRVGPKEGVMEPRPEEGTMVPGPE
jgi:hypothetical protein